MNALTKALFVDGARCDKLLWYRRNAAGDIPVSAQPTEVGDQLVHRAAYLSHYYPTAIQITSRPGVDTSKVQQTRSALTQRLPIRGAVMVQDGALARVDLLVPISGGHWDAYLFARADRPTTEEDFGLRYALHVFFAAGIPINTGYFFVLNTSYRRQGDIDAAQLYTTREVSDFHRSDHEIAPAIAQCRRVIERKEKPVVEPGEQCRTPSICPLANHCWISAGMEKDYRSAHDREGHEVFASYYARHERFGVEPAPQLPRSRKNPAWARSHPSFLTTVTFPVFCVGIRSSRPPIPRYDGMRPMQSLPYLYSIHALARPGAEPHAYTWLASEDGDTRHEALTLLREDLWESGTVIIADSVHKESFLHDVAKDFPEHRDWHAQLLHRLITYQHFMTTEFFNFHMNYLKRNHMIASLPPLLGEHADHILLTPGQSWQEFQRATDPSLDERTRRRIGKALQQRYSLMTLAMATRVRMIPKFENRLYASFQ